MPISTVETVSKNLAYSEKILDSILRWRMMLVRLFSMKSKITDTSTSLFLTVKSILVSPFFVFFFYFFSCKILKISCGSLFASRFNQIYNLICNLIYNIISNYNLIYNIISNYNLIYNLISSKYLFAEHKVFFLFCVQLQSK